MRIPAVMPDIKKLTENTHTPEGFDIGDLKKNLPNFLKENKTSIQAIAENLKQENGEVKKAVEDSIRSFYKEKKDVKYRDLDAEEKKIWKL